MIPFNFFSHRIAARPEVFSNTLRLLLLVISLFAHHQVSATNTHGQPESQPPLSFQKIMSAIKSYLAKGTPMSFGIGISIVVVGMIGIGWLAWRSVQTIAHDVETLPIKTEVGLKRFRRQDVALITQNWTRCLPLWPKALNPVICNYVVPRGLDVVIQAFNRQLLSRWEKDETLLELKENVMVPFLNKITGDQWGAQNFIVVYRGRHPENGAVYTELKYQDERKKPILLSLKTGYR